MRRYRLRWLKAQRHPVSEAGSRGVDVFGVGERSGDAIQSWPSDGVRGEGCVGAVFCVYSGRGEM